jgi:hypothetical protein
MVVVCYPGHMRPNKWGKATRHLWGKIKKHPNWTYRMTEGKCVPLKSKPMHFFPNSAAYDPDRGVVVGHKPGAIYELAGEPRTWKRTASGKSGRTTAVYALKLTLPQPEAAGSKD